MREPMLASLLGGGAIYLVLGDLKEAIILLAFASLSILITVIAGGPHRTCPGSALRPHQSAGTGDS